MGGFTKGNFDHLKSEWLAFAAPLDESIVLEITQACQELLTNEKTEQGGFCIFSF